MGYVDTYPEATTRRDEYQRVIDALNTEKAVIDTAVNTNLRTVGAFTDGSLVGDYYDVYNNKVSEWMTSAITIKNAYTHIQSALNTRIINATTQRNLWNTRIGQKTWVEDPVV